MDGAGDKNGGNKPPIRPTVSLNQTLAWSGTSQLPAEVWGEEDSGNGKFASGSFRRRGPGSGPNFVIEQSGPLTQSPDDENIPWSTEAELQSGDRIAQYEIIRKLGSGGMGVVYLARDNRLGRRVAIKVLRAREPEFTSRFLAEAQTTARCTHENIVVIHEVGEHQGEPFMVLEYLEGQTLAALRGVPQPVTRIVEIVANVVRALTRAHREGIVHRDLKPENIFLTNGGSVKVLDFGIAKIVHGETEEGPTSRRLEPSGQMWESRGSAISGTMAYMSPEQWGFAGAIDHRTDIWAVGLILYELLSGTHPIETLAEPIPWIRDSSAAFPPLSSVAPDVPPELGSVVDTCVRKSMVERYADASSLLRALEPFLPGHYSAAGPIQLELGPYAGLRAFQEEDAGRFFGREKEIAALATRLIETPLIAIVGPSGIGKSSLLRAGVLPTLKASGERWRTLVLRPGRDPMAALARVISPMVAGGGDGADEQKRLNELRAKLILEPGYFGNVLRAEAQRLQTRLLVVVDQFEELYTLERHGLARKAFTACLTGAADDPTSPLRVATTLRADFLGRVAEDTVFMDELSKGLVFLGPPTPDGLRQALVRPAELAGYRFETEAMVDEMVNYLEATPGGLPLLQFAAAQLWETRDPARKVLTEGAYRGLGGVGGALVSHADRVLTKLSPTMRAACRSLFVQLVTREGTRAVRRVDELRELITTDSSDEDVDRLLHHLVESRLIVTQSSDGAASAEIVHESLVSNWPTLRRWLDESQEDGLFLDQLLAAARQWNANRRDSGLLWGGDMVTELERFERRYKGKLPQIATDFTEAVYTVARSGARKRKTLLAGGILLLLGLLAAATVTLVVIRRSQLEAQEAARAAEAAHLLARQELEERKRAEEGQRALSNELRAALLTLQEANSELADRKRALEQRERELKGAMSRLQDAVVSAETSRMEALRQKHEADRARETAQLAKESAIQAYEEQRERVEILTSKVGSIVRDLK